MGLLPKDRPQCTDTTVADKLADKNSALLAAWAEIDRLKAVVAAKNVVIDMGSKYACPWVAGERPTREEYDNAVCHAEKLEKQGAPK